MNLDVGVTIGDYQIIGILGAGGMGKVYKVRNTISDRVEAMKVLLPDLVNEPDLADRFLREIKVQASLEHPNIAALHTAVRVDNQLLMLMECVEGVTLDQKLTAAKGPLPMAEAVDYIRQVLAALDFAHGRGVIHRDIKPANMMLTPEGVVKLMDFGIAKAATDRKLTMTGTTMGSLYYMSPEQIQGVSGLDSRSDLYSMGVSLYELVTGKRPFDGDSQFAIMAAHLEKTPVPPIELDPKLPPMLNDVILMSVLKDPNARFQSAGAFRNALGNVATGISTQPQARMATVPLAAHVGQAVPPAQLPRAQAAPPAPPIRPRGKRALWMGLGAAAAAVAVIAFIALSPGKHARAQVDPANPTATVEPAPQATSAQQASSTQPAQPETKPETQPAGAANPPATPTAETKPARAESKNAGKPTESPSPSPTRKDPQQQATTQQPVNPQPASPQTSNPQPQPSNPQPQQQPANPQPQPQQPAENPAVRAQLQEVREQMIMLNVRANGIRGALQRLESQQAAGGLGMSANLTGPRDLMNSYLDEVTNALNAGDPDTAKSMMKKAALQVERLEKLLNR